MHHERPQRLLAAVSCAFALLASGTTYADTVTEFKVKAAFLYNFTKFVKWPSTTFAGATDPLTICTSGEQPFAGILGETVAGKTVDERPLVTRQIKTDGDLKGCQVLFASETEMSRNFSSISTSKFPGVLIVSDAQNSKTKPSNPAIITFVLDANRVRFRINNTAAEKAGLTISSRLLSLAVNVE